MGPLVDVPMGLIQRITHAVLASHPRVMFRWERFKPGAVPVSTQIGNAVRGHLS